MKNRALLRDLISRKAKENKLLNFFSDIQDVPKLYAAVALLFAMSVFFFIYRNQGTIWPIEPMFMLSAMCLGIGLALMFSHIIANSSRYTTGNLIGVLAIWSVFLWSTHLAINVGPKWPSKLGITIVLIVLIIACCGFLYRWTRRLPIIQFCNSIGLVAGVSASEHKNTGGLPIRQQLAALIEDPALNKLDFVLVNGYDEFVKYPEIKDAILNRLNQAGSDRNKFDVRVWLLDPSSEFANVRAEALHKDDSLKSATEKRAIAAKQFLESTKFLRENQIEFKIYTSRPFYRLFIGSRKINDVESKWCFMQNYLQGMHGFATPLYRFYADPSTEDTTFIKLAIEVKEWLDERSYAWPLTDSNLEDDSNLNIYRAKMYGLISKDEPKNFHKFVESNINPLLKEHLDQFAEMNKLETDKPHVAEYWRRVGAVEKKVEAGWYRRPSSDLSPVIIFIHGFLSGPHNCWVSEVQSGPSSWLELLEHDARFVGAGIYACRYETSWASKDYGTEDAAVDLYKELCSAKALNDPTREVALIGHSQGGIVALRLANLIAQDKTKEQKPFPKTMIQLIASPTFGATLAKNLLLACMSWILNNKQGKELKWGSPALVKLRNQITDQRSRKNPNGESIELDIYEFYEGKALGILKWVPFIGPVVKRENTLYFGPTENVRTFSQRDHSDICKPKDSKDDVYSQFMQNYQKVFVR